MATNIIKVKQIDNTELLDFLKSSLGLTLGTLSATHSYSEIFSTNVTINGALSATSSSTFSQPATFSSGLTSNSGIYINGVVSGQSASFSTFNIPVGTISSLTAGSALLTGIPIYDSGQASTAVLLPSGTVYGLKQIVNAPLFDKDANNDLMPATGAGTQVIMLCVSIGT